MIDKIKVHAISDGFVLITYFCNPSTNDDTCGSVINWSGFEVFTFTFESLCSDGKIVESLYDKGFLYVCYKSATKEIFWATYGSPDNNGAVSVISSNTITSIDTFNSDTTNIFTTEDGGYCIVTSSITTSGASILTTFIQKDSTMGTRGPFTIYQDNSNTITKIRIYECNIAYQSSGYNCVIQTTSGTQVTYSEVDFLSNLSNGNTVAPKIFDFTTLTAIGIITDIQPLNFGGYVVIIRDRTSNGNVFGKAIDNNGRIIEDWGLTEQFYTYDFVLPNNTIVAIPQGASNIGTIQNNNGGITILSTDQLTTFSTVDGGNGLAPGGPGGYGSSKYL
ncbi:hypothetical protein C1645_146049 [Glomus cerebriforme]|uniref:Uncharacterized protein n=1 Tax=Glomus cerebriforme TaxID=658196 RepID=A0A397SWY5_9GLOM|nr:hypothetical protein C1645_146049 [Glomus cerebriforme]